MREIKFRVWDNGVMKKFLRIPFYVDCDGNMYKDNDPHGVDMSGRRSISPLQNCTLMQATGLKDKNGKEIYEGDIIAIDGNKKTIVSWSDKFASFCIKNDTWMFQHWFGEAVDGPDCEVIGNIYSNPELL
jgi:uncharacterized phage protein (TIGR01671 family)